MKKKILTSFVVGVTMVSMLFGCGANATTFDSNDLGAEQVQAVSIEDGIYDAEFHTDSSMFHVNEAYNNIGTLKVENGQMTIHISLAGTGIVNLFPGTAEDAQKEGAVLLQPTTDLVTYSDGLTDEVYGFDVPVPYLDEEFDLALIGTKQTWYDHKVYVTNPVLKVEENSAEEVSDVQNTDNQSQDDVQETTEESNAGANADETIDEDAASFEIEDGTYMIEVTLTGGSGKSTIDSPTQITVNGDEIIATITWSSPNYDYMIVDDVKYQPINTEGNSVYEIPVLGFDYEMPVIADTVAMSEPHEIEYTINFISSTIQ